MLIRKEFKVEMAHRLVDSYSKRCQSIHGHSYKIEVILEGEPTKKEAEMVMDFKKIKDRINKFIDAFDHSFVLKHNDPILHKLRDLMDEMNMRYIIVPYNPTAEMMAIHIMSYCKRKRLPIHSVVVHETATGYAKALRSEDHLTIDLTKCYFSKAIGEELNEQGGLFNDA